ncbi:hypothetical protein NDU88_001530 [Pleurodeles waltl]|uniref:Uncharacterized protein n=1 Tax=Pleurodeles waltl TaxID=8319 RepID=A0AAV7MK01_PLEWA|nr:hypothetical protein NDU88_001530 [Pleurodeles waltl]
MPSRPGALKKSRGLELLCCAGCGPGRTAEESADHQLRAPWSWEGGPTPEASGEVFTSEDPNDSGGGPIRTIVRSNSPSEEGNGLSEDRRATTDRK